MLSGAITSTVAAKEVELTICNSQAPDSIKITHKLLRIFEEEHPGIKVTYIDVPWTDYHMKLVIQYAAGTIPDVILRGGGEGVPLIAAGGMISLDPYISGDPTVDLSKVNKWALDGNTYKGKLYAFPYSLSPVNTVYYNKDMFKELGIPFPERDWDINECLAAAKKIATHDEKGRLTRIGLYTYHPENWVFMYGGGS